MERSDFLVPHLRVDAHEVTWFFISDYWAGPVAGLAFFEGQLFRFCCFPEDVPEQRIYVLQVLTEEEKARELAEKERFEQLMGTHWSYDLHGQPLPHIVRAPELQQSYLKEKKERPTPEPRDRPVALWFDIARGEG